MQISYTFPSHPLRAWWYGTLSGPGHHAVHVLIQVGWGPWFKSKSGKLRETRGPKWRMLIMKNWKSGSPCPTRLRTKLNFLFVFVSIKSRLLSVLLSVLLVKIKWQLSAPASLRWRARSQRRAWHFFPRLSGVRGWGLSSQLRLSKAEILSVFRFAEF